MIKSIRIIAYIIATLFLIAAIWFGYENLNQVRKSTNDLDKSINEIIIYQSTNYDKEQQELDRIEKNLTDSEARLKKLFEEVGLEW